MRDWPLGGEPRGVAHGLARGKIAQRDDAGAQREARLDGQALLHLLAFVRRVERLVVAVQDGAGTNHIRPGGGPRADSAAIGHVDDARVNPQGAHLLEAGAEQLLLVVGLPGAEIFGGRKMRAGAFELQMRAIEERFGEGLDFGRRDSQAVHARIDFQVKAQAAGQPAGGLGRALQMPDVFQARQRGRQAVRDETLLFPRPESREDQDGLADARLAQLDAFIRAGHAEAVRARLLQRFGNGHRAQAVGVGFDHRQNLRLRPDVPAHHAQIPGNGFQRNFGPQRTSVEMNRFRHVLLECQSRPRVCDENPKSRIIPQRYGKQGPRRVRGDGGSRWSAPRRHMTVSAECDVKRGSTSSGTVPASEASAPENSRERQDGQRAGDAAHSAVSRN